MTLNSHPDATAFLARILAEPSDPVIRSIFADWLEEQSGESNTNWARYLKLRIEAKKHFGIQRDLLWEEAANIAPYLKARLTVAAHKFAPHFLDFLDLLPPDRFTVSLRDFVGPTAANEKLGEEFCRKFGTLVLGEQQDQYAIATNAPMPALSILLRRQLTGRIVLFPSPLPEILAALDRQFPSKEPNAPDTFEEIEVESSLKGILRAAREAGATVVEVIAQPSNFEVRLAVNGRARRHETLSVETGKKIVLRAFEAAVTQTRDFRVRPRNSSFGNGVEIELL